MTGKSLPKSRGSNRAATVNDCVRVVRFHQHRARSAADVRWSGRVIDALRAMVGLPPIALRRERRR